jgi:hypothetical protein
MKKILVLAIVALVSVQAMAANGKAPAPAENQGQGISPGGSDGCGLGWQVTDKKTLSATTTRGTTNATIPATFGMTSGTIGCEKHEFAKNEMPAVTYAFNNMDNLSVEMAQGHGEYLEGFAVTLGCGKAMTDTLGQFTRAHYSQILDQNSDGVQVYENVRNLIRQDATLSAVCENVG